MPTLQAELLIDFVSRIFAASGAPEQIAREVAASLVASDMAGHTSHGVVRVRQYLDGIAAGTLQPAARPSILPQIGSIATVDGQRGFGQVAARFAMETAISKAATHGIAAAGLRNAGHVGRMGEWVELAAAQQMIGLAWCNGGGPRGAVAPFGGATRLLGTNPLAAAVPVAGQPPLVLDFATSAVAEGKLRVARNRGQAIPEGWILDADGQASSDPNDFYAGGMLLPFGGHKGYGLSLLVECLAGLLTGAGWPGQDEFAGGNGVLFVVLSVAAFRPAEGFLDDMAALRQRVTSVPPAAGFTAVVLPGQPEQQAAARQQASGLALDDVSWAQLRDAAATLGVAVPAL